MNTLRALVLALALGVSGVALVPPPTAEAALTGARSQLWREVVRFGDRDRSVRHIKHVVELQRRLHRAGVRHQSVTGYFGKATRRQVRRFQRKAHLRVTGVANHATWKRLIRRTTRTKVAPRSCKRKGWRVCYNRRRHDLMLFRNGRLWNSWLVRGGARAYKTRLGHFRVFYRNRDHVSSIYGSPMPYSQFFSGGQALHGSTLMMDPYKGHSHGCVNMYLKDARQLWRLTSQRRLHVIVFGRWH